MYLKNAFDFVIKTKNSPTLEAYIFLLRYSFRFGIIKYNAFFVSNMKFDSVVFKNYVSVFLTNL